jgi:hypothetical protein
MLVFHRQIKVSQCRPQSIANPILIIFGAARPIHFIKLFPKLQASIFIVCELYVSHRHAPERHVYNAVHLMRLPRCDIR